MTVFHALLPSARNFYKSLERASTEEMQEQLYHQPEHAHTYPVQLSPYQ